MEKIVNLYFSIFAFALILVSLFTNANFWSFTPFFILVFAVDFGIVVVFISAQKFLREGLRVLVGQSTQTQLQRPHPRLGLRRLLILRGEIKEITLAS